MRDLLWRIKLQGFGGNVSVRLIPKEETRLVHLGTGPWTVGISVPLIQYVSKVQSESIVVTIIDAVSSKDRQYV